VNSIHSTQRKGRATLPLFYLLVAAALAPFFQMMVWGMEPAMACIVPMSLLLIWRHAANIRKLLDGTETKIGQKSAAKAASKAGRKA
jgi:glycerol-3-phosphate acyltransferase PlsY